MNRHKLFQKVLQILLKMQAVNLLQQQLQMLLKQRQNQKLNQLIQKLRQVLSKILRMSNLFLQHKVTIIKNIEKHITREGIFLEITNLLMKWIYLLKQLMTTIQVGKLINVVCKSIMPNIVKMKMLILHKLKQIQIKTNLSLDRDQNGKKRWKKLRNIKNNFHHMIKFQILNCHNNLTGEM